jgi:hypothetical protein
MTPELQAIRAMAQRRLMSIPPNAKAAYDSANEELQEIFKKQDEPAPGLQFKRRKSTEHERIDLDSPATKAAAVVVNADAAKGLADAMQKVRGRQSDVPNRKLADGNRRYQFDNAADQLAEAMERARAAKQSK